MIGLLPIWQGVWPFSSSRWLPCFSSVRLLEAGYATAAECARPIPWHARRPCTSLILLAGAYVVAENIWPGNKQPSLIQEAKVTPMIRAGALLLNGFLPKGFKILDAEAVGTVTDKTKEAVKKRVFERLVRPDTPKSRDEERPGYDTKERNSLERAIDRLNQSTP